MAQGELKNFINSLNVSDEWKRIFKLINFTYCHSFYGGNYKNTFSWVPGFEITVLDPKDKMKFFCKFNFFALIFGPFYYLAKGMIPKGIILAIIMWFLYSFNNITASLMPLVMVYCSVYANLDFFVHKVLKSKKIKDNPGILEDSFDQKQFDRIINNKSPISLLAYVEILLYITILVFMGLGTHEEYMKTNALNKVPDFCGKHGCEPVLAKKLALLKTGKGQRHVVEYKVACIYAKMKNNQAAFNYANNANRTNPKYVPPYLLKAYLYLNAGKLEHVEFAITNYKSALKHDKKLKGANHGIGRCLYKQKKYKDALAYFEIATKRYPFNANYFEMQGYAKVYLKNIAGAKKDLNRAAFLYTFDFTPHNKKRAEALKKYIGMLK